MSPFHYTCRVTKHIFPSHAYFWGCRSEAEAGCSYGIIHWGSNNENLNIQSAASKKGDSAFDYWLYFLFQGVAESCLAIFLPALVMGNFMVLNLFLALLLNSFNCEELKSRKEVRFFKSLKALKNNQKSELCKQNYQKICSAYLPWKMDENVQKCSKSYDQTKIAATTRIFANRFFSILWYYILDIIL